MRDVRYFNLVCSLTESGESGFSTTYYRYPKYVYYKRGERPALKEFLKTNFEKCGICVYGHFIYAEGPDYWSFFDNDNDEIVAIWYLKEKTNG